MQFITVIQVDLGEHLGNVSILTWSTCLGVSVSVGMLLSLLLISEHQRHIRNAQ